MAELIRTLDDGVKYYDHNGTTVVVQPGQTIDDVLEQLSSRQVSEFNDALASMIESTAYARNRQNEYPPITDYIDGVVKGDQAQIDAYIAACQAVKNKYPKPE